MKRIILNSITLGIALLFFACSSKNEDSKDLAKELNEQKFDTTEIENDTKFMVDAADRRSLEVELGKLAQVNGSAQSVKDFGKSVALDLAMVNDELAKIAKQKNISLPMDLSDQKQKTMEDFAAKNAKDPQIKAWVAARIPVLRRHLTMGQALKDRVSKVRSNTTS